MATQLLEVIEIKDKSPSVSSTPASANFGDGIELLMNEKRKNAAEDKTSGEPIKGINELEAELNSLSGASPTTAKRPDVFKLSLEPPRDGPTNIEHGEKKHVVTTATQGLKLNIGKATSDVPGMKDPFKELSNIPMNPDTVEPAPRVNQESVLQEKFTILRKLDALERKGVQITKKYGMESSLAEMKGEYEMIVSDRERLNSIKFQGKMLMAAITGIEFLNTKFDPFDVSLDGWGEQVNENVDDYDDIFGELHDKYKTRAKMAPELKLLFQLAGSAIMVHMTNTMFKSSMPGMDDIMRQNPELMQQFTKAAVSSMGKEQPGFGGLMNDILDPEHTPDLTSGPPPPAMRTRMTKTDRSAVPTGRPDMSAARDAVGIEIGDHVASAAVRPEMKGPTNIDDILSGLKHTTTAEPLDDSSSISIQDLKELSDAKVPTRSKRGKGAHKATVSLDI